MHGENKSEPLSGYTTSCRDASCAIPAVVVLLAVFMVAVRLAQGAGLELNCSYVCMGCTKPTPSTVFGMYKSLPDISRIDVGAQARVITWSFVSIQVLKPTGMYAYPLEQNPLLQPWYKHPGVQQLVSGQSVTQSAASPFLGERPRSVRDC